MNIYDALILKAVGGGGGTTVVANPEGEATDDLEKLQVGNEIYEIPKDYEDLDNKPSINSVELDGNKTASDLGLQTELKGAQTLSGNPITITDAEAMNAESVVVELEPKQDLHGYDAPWVGGASKNLLPMTVDGIKSANTSGMWSGNTYTLNGRTFTLIVDDANNIIAIKVGGSTNSYITLDIPFNLPAGEYILSKGGMRARLIKDNDVINDGTDNYTFSVTDINDDYVYALFPGTGSVSDVEVTPMIRLATETDPTFAPYSNICPISGYSEVNVVNFDNSNLFDESSAQNGYFDNSGNLISNAGWKSDYIDVTEDAYYRISGCNEMIGGAYFIWFDSNKDKISIVSEHKNGIYLAPTNAFYLGVSEATGNENISVTTGNTYTVSLGGTKYGGTLDVTEGGYSDEWGYIEGDSVSDLTSLGATTGTTGGRLFYISFGDIGTPTSSDTTPTRNVLQSNELDNKPANYIWEENTSGITSDNQGYIYFTVKDITTQADMDTWLSNNPIQIAYRKKTPSSVSTTPTDIPLLENTNNVSTDGTNIQLKYQPNNVIGECKAYTDEKCAEVLPPLPTTDGTYHLSCEVTSGVGALSWVSDS